MINPQSQTTVEQFVQGFVRDRSRILHGTWSTLLHASRPSLTTLARDLLTLYSLSLDQYIASASPKDNIDLFLDFVDAQRKQSAATAPASAVPATLNPP